MTDKKILFPLILASLLFTAVNSAFASEYQELSQIEDQSTRKEAFGFFGGAVLGGLVAGPPGAFIAASLGILTASVENEHDKKELLAAQLEQNQQELLALQEQQAELQNRYQLALQEIESNRLQNVRFTSQSTTQQGYTICCEDTALALHFTTNSYALEQHYREDIEQLADLANQDDQTIVLINGYADKRGNSFDNQKLSEQRVESVRQALLELGVNPNNIQTRAFGDTRPLEQNANLESLFFDRRVNVELRSKNGELFTLRK